MKKLFNEMCRAKDYSVVVDTFALRRKLGVLDRKWAGFGQEDAHEFLTQIISTLQVILAKEIDCPLCVIPGGLQQKCSKA